jgi:outer membrane receptor protein involved in Fe transport
VHSPTEFLAQVPRSPNVLVYGDDRRDRLRELALYGEMSREVAPGWTVALGGRVFTIGTHTRSQVVSELFPPRSVDRRTHLTGFSPKVSVQWRTPAGNLLYAVISEGYRGGGVNSGGARPLSPVRETFSPDRLRNYELGWKLETLASRLSLNSAVFFDRWEDIQTDQFRPSGIPYTTNAGDADVLGLETELAFRADNGLSAQLNGRVSRTRTRHANPDLTSRLSDGLPGAPAVSGGALVSYEREVFGDWTLRLVGQGAYVGRSRVTFDAGQPTMGGYTRTKVSAELTGRGLGLQVYLLNPLNAYSDTFAFGNPFNPGQTRQITPQRPRTLGVTLSAAL